MGAGAVAEVAPVGTGTSTVNSTKAWGHQVRLGMPAISADDSTIIAGVRTTSTAKSAPTVPNLGTSSRSVGQYTRNYAQ